MRILENNHGGNWIDRLLNAWPFCIDQDNVNSWAVAWDADGIYFPDDLSLFCNGYVMVRVCWPLGVFVHIKPVRNARFQFGIGWKVNGRVGLTLRWQTDESAANGTHGQNVGQAKEWNRGAA